jgi:protein TonB
MPAGLPEVYSLDEIARAAYVDVAAVEALVRRHRLPLVSGTPFVAEPDAVQAARVLRHAALLAAQPVERPLFGLAARPGSTPRPAAWSFAVHAAAVILLVTFGRSATPSATASAPAAASRLVFLVTPGPGGGGGGGGVRAPRPARRLESAAAPQPDAVPVPKISRRPAEEPAPDPVTAPAPAAPLATVAAEPQRRDGEIDGPRYGIDRGPGLDGAGWGSHGGNGPGRGTGVGDGEGGGAGGGPYRAGSGIEPPRVLREVKGTYSEEARRANVTGDVVREVVVRADGTVASARVTRGLGFGLDERAVAAVRQWRFAPARRGGVPVDVAVEVAMEFNLR